MIIKGIKNLFLIIFLLISLCIIGLSVYGIYSSRINIETEEVRCISIVIVEGICQIRNVEGGCNYGIPENNYHCFDNETFVCYEYANLNSATNVHCARVVTLNRNPSGGRNLAILIPSMMGIVSGGVTAFFIIVWITMGIIFYFKWDKVIDKNIYCV